MRQELKELLRKRAGIFAVSTTHEALKSINQADPQAVLVALDLGPGSEMHGLKFAQMVRRSPGGDLRRLIVYGVPEGKSPSLAKVSQLMESYELDLYIGTNLPPEQLAKELLAGLDLKGADSGSGSPGHWWSRSKPESNAFDASEAGELSMRDILETSSVVTAKMKTVDPNDISWWEVLHEDVSIASIRKLLTKDIRLGND
jgi:hypothetical protein